MAKVYLVGAGPGAADLLTVRAARLLGEADIVFHDALVGDEVLALAQGAVLVAVGKRCGRHATAQRFINKRLIDAARQYRVVVRLKGGDPMLFGRAQEEIDALVEAEIDVEVVPGVTAALAAAAQLSRSLTRRGISRAVAFVTPRIGEGEKDSGWARAAAAAETSILYMAATASRQVAAALLEAGIPAGRPLAVVVGASLGDSTVLLSSLGRLAAEGFSLPPGDDRPVLFALGDVFEAIAQPRALAVGEG